ncbi:MAG: threonine ammonia-lyase, biosynthetic, partial [Alcanivorax sp.]
EKPGSFQTFCSTLGRHGISEFNYRYNDEKLAHIFVGVRVNGDPDRHDLVAELKAKGYQLSDLTDNEMAKLHIRHMVGGHAPRQDMQERLFRVEFPERPGALMKFLQSLGEKWNISLFHYRNHGAAYGRVLVGFQVESGKYSRLLADLKKVPYPMVEESDNPAYRLFLD